MHVDGLQFLVAEVSGIECSERIRQLLHAGSSDQCGGHGARSLISQHSRDSHLSQILSTLMSYIVEGANVIERLIGEEFARNFTHAEP